MLDQILVTCRARGRECQIEPACRRDEIPYLGPRQRLRTAIERETLGHRFRKNARVQLAQGSGEPVQVVPVPGRSYIGIGSEPREPLHARRQSTYEHETDAVFCQDFDDPLGVEWGGLSHDAPPP